MLGEVQGAKSAGATNGCSEQCAAAPADVLNTIVGVLLLVNAAGLVVIARAGAVVSTTNTLGRGQPSVSDLGKQLGLVISAVAELLTPRRFARMTRKQGRLALDWGSFVRAELCVTGSRQTLPTTRTTREP